MLQRVRSVLPGARRSPYPASALVCGLLVCCSLGCVEEQGPEPEVLRSIKAITVSERPRGYERRFAGVLASAETSALAFQVGGVVQHVAVDLGQRVLAGQLLARIDPQPYQLRVDAARSDVERAQVGVDDAGRDLQRVEALRGQGAASQRQLDDVQAAFDSARSSLQSAKAAFELADRDLEHSELRAPFEGAIASRKIEPFEEVPAGKPVFVLQSDKGFKVEVLIPENVIDLLSVGQSVKIRMAGFRLRDRLFDGRVSEIGTTAPSANAYPVKVELHEPDPRFRPGMTAEVQFTYQGAAEEASWLVPLHAVLPDDADSERHVTERELFVFVYDPENSTVRRRAVRLLNVQGENAVIREGLAAGDIVAVAGVSFLRDGQRVGLLDEDDG